MNGVNLDCVKVRSIFERVVTKIRWLDSVMFTV